LTWSTTASHDDSHPAKQDEQSIQGAASPRPPHQALSALLEYIGQVERLGLKPAPIVPAEFYCAYEEELRDLPGVAFDLTHEGDESWLRIARLEPTTPPALPANLEAWVTGGASPDAPPMLQLDQPGRPARVPDPEARDAMAAAHAAYRDGPWAEWAATERPRRAAMRAYQRLHSIHRLIAAEGAETPLELVWGVGMVVWRHAQGRTIVHPLTTIPVEVRLDARTLDLEVRPRQTPPTLETAAFNGLHLPGLAALEAHWRTIEAQVDGALSPFDLSAIDAFLRTAASALDAAGQYWPDVRTDRGDRALPERRAYPVVTDTWVLYARRRSPHFLLEDAQRLRDALAAAQADGRPVPGGPAALVLPVADDDRPDPPVHFRGLSYIAPRAPRSTGTPDVPGAAPTLRELYFPKPYNAEQVSIIQKLEQADGVVVQGPPGTGKTHTIANIICHYLASGKRVLVTSKGDAALAVLREHVPEAVRPLTVALLADEKDGMAQFEHAVQTIATNVARIDIAEAERAAETLAGRVNDLHERIANVDQELSRWASLHLRRVRFLGRDMLPDELARHVIEKRAECEWLVDRLSIQSNAPRFTAADIASARKARIALGRDIVYLGIDLPAFDRLPDAPAIAALHEGLIHARRLSTRIREERTPPFIDDSDDVKLQAASLRGAAVQALALHDHAFARDGAGTERLCRLYRDDHSPARQHLDAVLQELAGVDALRQAFVARPVEVPPDVETDPKFVDTVARAAAGKRPFGLLAIGKGELKARLDSVRVDGLAPRDAGDWSHAHAWIQFLQQARAALTRWNAVAAEAGLATVAVDDADGLRDALAQAEHVALVRRLVVDLEPAIDAELPRVFGATLRLATCGEGREGVARLVEILDRNLQQAELTSVMPTYGALLNFCTGRGGPVLTAMRSFLADQLGRRDLAPTQAAEKWGALRAELRRLAGLRQAFARLERVADLVAASGAPQWADKLRTVPALDANDAWTRPDWLDAWHWRQVATLLDSIDGRDALARLQKSRSDLEADLARAYQRLVEARTWVQVCRNSPDSVKAALQAYLNAILHIGRGAGLLRASRYRREARRAMQLACPAVPCWIMPHWRVSETLPAEIGHFDLVVVDEASQSDLWALPCIMRGTKLLIVGDDRQVAPDASLLGEETIASLRTRHLSGQMHADQMSPEKSLYDLARVVFAGSMVMLREHFRCVAPIIEFSRREFYRDEIRPLRIPRPSERLDPPLVDILVHGATRRGHINEAEARAIVREIQAILVDPKCAGRSIGVVSLAGLEQAQHIFDVIRDVVPPEDVVARRITVGDARTFQGKERDIMLLSLVTTPDDKMTATGAMYEQRFNVAASRARDRMVLVRSVDTGDLATGDLKARLIEHFARPFRDEIVRPAKLRELCQTSFERELHDALVMRGYRVRPQVRVGANAIDLVVEGEGDRRLAIECDGDQYDGPDQWARDMARQRMLERAGWTFWRAFASSFILQRDALMGDLTRVLDAMGIRPAGATDEYVERYCEHREIEAAALLAKPAARQVAERKLA